MVRKKNRNLTKAATIIAEKLKLLIYNFKDLLPHTKIRCALIYKEWLENKTCDYLKEKKNTYFQSI